MLCLSFLPGVNQTNASHKISKLERRLGLCLGLELGLGKRLGLRAEAGVRAEAGAETEASVEADQYDK